MKKEKHVDETQPLEVYRQLPDPLRIQEEVNYHFAKRWAPVVTTLTWQIHKPSARKTDRLLRTAAYVTDLEIALLDHYREDLDHIREDGAIALVLSAEGTGENRSRNIGWRMEQECLQRLGMHNYHFSARIHSEVCRNVATMLINWVQKIATFAEQDDTDASVVDHQPSSVLTGRTVADIHRAWQAQQQQYDAAKAIIIPWLMRR